MDEVSIVMTPIAEGTTTAASLFDGNEKYNNTDPVGPYLPPRMLIGPWLVT